MSENDSRHPDDHEGSPTGMTAPSPQEPAADGGFLPPPGLGERDREQHGPEQHGLEGRGRERRSRGRSRARRAARGIGWTLAASGVLALAGLSAYLWITHDEWMDQNDQLRTEALDLGEQLAVARAEAEQAIQERASVQLQLEEAKSTISTLADQDANTTDGFAYAEDLIEQLFVCADERAELIDYLWQAERYTTSSLRGAESSIDEFCAGLEESWENFQEEQ